MNDWRGYAVRVRRLADGKAFYIAAAGSFMGLGLFADRVSPRLEDAGFLPFRFLAKFVARTEAEGYSAGEVVEVRSGPEGEIVEIEND